jgi:hypothetical protein
VAAAAARSTSRRLAWNFGLLEWFAMFLSPPEESNHSTQAFAAPCLDIPVVVSWPP